MIFAQHIPENEIEWTTEPIIGILLVNAELDSFLNPIEPYSSYRVGKHLPSGMLIILPANKNEAFNEMLKEGGQLS